MSGSGYTSGKSDLPRPGVNVLVLVLEAYVEGKFRTGCFIAVAWLQMSNPLRQCMSEIHLKMFGNVRPRSRLRGEKGRQCGRVFTNPGDAVHVSTAAARLKFLLFTYRYGCLSSTLPHPSWFAIKRK